MPFNSFPLLDQRKIRSFLFHKCDLEKEKDHHFCKQYFVSCEAKIGKEPNSNVTVSVYTFHVQVHPYAVKICRSPKGQRLQPRDSVKPTCCEIAENKTETKKSH